MRTLGLIPARGGSKGLPGKNTRPLAGRPLIYWSCRAALGSIELDEVMCTTDAERIAEIARETGVSVPFMRPAELAGDETLIVDVIRHVLLRLVQSGRHFDYVCLIQPTSPLIAAEDIDNAVRLAGERDADTVISGFPCGQKHPATMFRMADDGAVQWLLPAEERMARRQDLAPVYIRSGLVYVFRSAMIIENGTMYGNRIFALEVPEERALSIDSALDFQMAELLFSHKQAGGSVTDKTKAGDPEAFDKSWATREETHYLHWTRGEPNNQIQLAFRQHWSLFNEIMGGRYAGGKVLEVGCGRGSLSAYFADAGYDCTLLDLSSAAIDRAKQAFRQHGLKARFDVGNALALPYGNGTFDVVFSIGLLEHFEDIAAVIREQARILRSGGLFLGYVVPENRNNIQKDYEWINDLLRAMAPDAYKQSAQQKEAVYRSDDLSPRYINAMREAGLNSIEASGTYPLPMISYSPDFPFTLLNDAAEAVLVRHFSRILEKRGRERTAHPWLCEESLGQAFLVWGQKP